MTAFVAKVETLENLACVETPGHGLCGEPVIGDLVTSSTISSIKRPDAPSLDLSRLHQSYQTRKASSVKEGLRRACFEESESLIVPSCGIIDTIRISLMSGLAAPDRRRLSSLGLFPSKTNMRGIRGPNDDVIELDPGAQGFYREFDGLRLFVEHDKCSVEVSLSRVLGIPNDCLHQLSSLDVESAISKITTKLLPYSTEQALLRRPAYLASCREDCWGVVKLTLARDFKADAAVILKAYTHASWQRCRNLLVIHSRNKDEPRSGYWKGKNNRLVIYDKGFEMLCKGIEQAPHPGMVTRIERQWRGAETLSILGRFIGAFPSGSSSLRLLQEEAMKTMVVSHGFTNEILHQALMNEVSLLDSPVALYENWPESLAAAMVESPDLYRAFVETRSKATVRKYQKLITAIKLSAMPTASILHASYGKGVGH